MRLLYACPNDELDFAQQIAALMDDPERRKKMGEIGRELAWRYQERHLLEAYEALSADLPRRRSGFLRKRSPW